MPSTNDFSDVERQLVEDACAAFQRTTIRFKAKPALSAARQARAAHGAEDGAVQFDINPKFQWRLGELALVPHALGLSSGFRFLSTGGSV